MKIKISFIALLLPLFIISGCDSDQKSPASKKVESIKSAPVAVETPAPMVDQASTTTENEVVTAVTEAVQKAAMSGEQVYKKSCVGCHGTGAAGAPKIGDAVAWGPRIAKGNDALYNSAKIGVPGTAMMAKGTCGACSDEELEAAVDFMISGSK